MNEITLAAWNTLTYQRDLTFLNLFIIAAVALAAWRLWIAGHQLIERLAPGVGVLAYLSLLALGVVELWRM